MEQRRGPRMRSRLERSSFSTPTISASSTVCTTQPWIAVCAGISLAWLGTAGLRELAIRCARGTRYCREGLLAIDGVEPLFDAPVLREFALRLPIPADTVVERMAESG